MHLPRISIVTPVFNGESFIEETLVSVLEQSYPNLQYIVVDGGSTDSTLKIIKKYEKYLDCLISEPDCGQSDAIRKGLRLCSGEVFNWLNADDTYNSDTLKVVAQYFSNPATQVLAGKSLQFGMFPDSLSSGTTVSSSVERTIGRARIDQPETFFRLSRVLALGGPSIHFHYVMDREFWIRYLICFGIEGFTKIDNVLVNFRHHSNSKTISNQSGFVSESETLGKWILELSQNDIAQVRSQVASSISAPLNLRKIKYEWSLYHFQMAYALRDWDQMDYWFGKLRGLRASLSSILCPLNLYSRRMLLNTFDLKE